MFGFLQLLITFHNLQLCLAFTFSMASTKTPNSKTKTTAENVDLTSDILSHLRFLNIMAVILSTTRVAESKIWHLYVVFRTERQPNWIPKRKDKKKQISVSLTTSMYVTFSLNFFFKKVPFTSLHFYFSFSFIFTRYSFDPQIANSNRGGSNLVIYWLINLFLYWLNLITLEIKRKWRNIT